MNVRIEAFHEKNYFSSAGFNWRSYCFFLLLSNPSILNAFCDQKAGTDRDAKIRENNGSG
jgi:hypothetical protein